MTEIIENNNDATLEELCDLLAAETGIRVSKATMGRISQNLNYTLKKNSPCCGERKGRSPTKKGKLLGKDSRY